VSPNLLWSLVPRLDPVYAALRERPPDDRAGVFFVYRLSGQQEQLALDVAGDLGRAFPDVHVDLAAHAELRQVHAGLDREADPRDDPALVARLQVVDVHAVAVDLVADRVAGAVQEVLAEAPRFDVP